MHNIRKCERRMRVKLHWEVRLVGSDKMRKNNEKHTVKFAGDGSAFEGVADKNGLPLDWVLPGDTSHKVLLLVLIPHI